MCLLQIETNISVLRWKLLRAKDLKCSMKILATTGDKNETMFVPSVFS
jgi:hypothetical protein